MKCVSSYIAGFVVRKLLPKLKCDECRGLLVDTHSCDTDMSSIRLKNNGGLVMPCASVVRTVHIAERKLRLLTLPGDKPMHAFSRMGSKLQAFVMHEVGNVHALFGNTSHITDTADGIEESFKEWHYS